MSEDKARYRRKKKEETIISFEMGRMPPQAIDIEEVVIGALLLEERAIDRIIDFLKPECFYKEAHSIIYKAIINIRKKSSPVDIITVTNELRKTGELEIVGGIYYITGLTNRIASSNNIEVHGRIILQKYIQRELIRINSNNIKESYDEATDIFELIDSQYNSLNNITKGIIKSNEKGSSRLFGEYLKRLEVIAASSSDVISGVPTTIRGINKITNGWQNSDLIIVASRPGMGKTSFIKSCIKGAIQYRQKPVVIFSLEMSASQLIGRFLSEDVQIPSQAFNSKYFLGQTDFKAINSAIPSYSDANGKDLLLIDDTAGLKINELKVRAKRMHAEHGICMIVIDYLQLINGDSYNNNKTVEIEEISKSLKDLGKDLDIPVIALSQLSRDVDKRSPPRPVLSDLRSSGGIEQSADVVGFLYRPEYYGITELPDGRSSLGYSQFIIAKHRNGELKDIEMKFIDHLTKFTDWNEDTPYNNSGYSDSKLTPNTEFSVVKSEWEDKPF